MIPLINDIKWLFYKGPDHLIYEIFHDPIVFITVSTFSVWILLILRDIIKRRKNDLSN